jgi:hypothetical protein
MPNENSRGRECKPNVRDRILLDEKVCFQTHGQKREKRCVGWYGYGLISTLTMDLEPGVPRLSPSEGL